MFTNKISIQRYNFFCKNANFVAKKVKNVAFFCKISRKQGCSREIFEIFDKH